MEIGVIGFGHSVLNLVLRASKADVTVYMYDSYRNNTCKEITDTNKNIILVGIPEAAKPKIVILFTAFDSMQTILGQLPDMTDKIILHAGNPIFNVTSSNAEISGKSAAQIVARLLPKSYVVKLYHEIQTVAYQNSECDNSNPKIFFSGENQEAKKMIKTFLDSIKFSGIDLTDKIYKTYI